MRISSPPPRGYAAIGAIYPTHTSVATAVSKVMGELITVVVRSTFPSSPMRSIIAAAFCSPPGDHDASPPPTALAAEAAASDTRGGRARAPVSMWKRLSMAMALVSEPEMNPASSPRYGAASPYTLPNVAAAAGPSPAPCCCGIGDPGGAGDGLAAVVDHVGDGEEHRGGEPGRGARRRVRDRTVRHCASSAGRTTAETSVATSTQV